MIIKKKNLRREKDYPQHTCTQVTNKQKKSKGEKK